MLEKVEEMEFKRMAMNKDQKKLHRQMMRDTARDDGFQNLAEIDEFRQLEDIVNKRQDRQRDVNTRNKDEDNLFNNNAAGGKQKKRDKKAMRK